MTDEIQHNSQTLTFLIGPPVLEGGRHLVDDDGRLTIKAEDEAAAWKDLLEIQNKGAAMLIEGGITSHVANFIEAVLGESFTTLVATVGTGTWKGNWLASIVVDLDQTQITSTQTLASLLSTAEVECIGDFIGESMHAAWMRTSWSKPLSSTLFGVTS